MGKCCSTQAEADFNALQKEWEGPFTDSGRIQPTPRRLPVDLPSPVVSLDCGRSHAMALDNMNRIYEWRSWGRIAQIKDSDRRWGRVKQICCGWSFSALLSSDVTGKNQVFIHHAPSNHAIISAASSQGFGSEGHASEGVLFPMDINSIQLPNLPKPYEQDIIVQIAAGDEFIVALSDNGHVFKVDVSAPALPPNQQPPPPERDRNRIEGMDLNTRERLQAAFIRGERTWDYMPFFCDMNRIASLPAFGEEGCIKPSKKAKISHVTAHFEHMVAYSVGESEGEQIVLMGRRETGPEDLPRVEAKLQGRNVIK